MAKEVRYLMKSLQNLQFPNLTFLIVSSRYVATTYCLRTPQVPLQIFSSAKLNWSYTITVRN